MSEMESSVNEGNMPLPDEPEIPDMDMSVEEELDISLPLEQDMSGADIEEVADIPLSSPIKMNNMPLPDKPEIQDKDVSVEEEADTSLPLEQDMSADIEEVADIPLPSPQKSNKSNSPGPKFSKQILLDYTSSEEEDSPTKAGGYKKSASKGLKMPKIAMPKGFAMPILDFKSMSTRKLKACLISLILLILLLIIVLATSFGGSTSDEKNIANSSSPGQTPTAPNGTPTISEPTKAPVPTATTGSPISRPTMGPTVSRATKLGNVFASKVPFDQLNIIQYNKSTKQNQAYQWLLDDPKFWSYDDRKLMQRWVMKVLSLEWTAIGGSHIRPDQLPLDSWGEYTDECGWFMSYYDNKPPCSETGALKRLVLTNVGLQGTIPSELRYLDRLNTVFLQDNELSGTIPAGLANWVPIETFDVSFNKLQGSIPKIGTTNLQYLDLGWNLLTGIVPDSLCALEKDGNLDFFQTDCKGAVECDCCSDCTKNN